MPYIGLFMKAEMENIEKIEFPEDTDWTLDVGQAGGVDKRERVTVSMKEEVEIPNSKGTANFVVKFEGSKAGSTMNVVTVTRKTDVKALKNQTLNEYSGGDFSPIAVFDCRGMEPTRWYPVGPCKVTAADGGKVFEDVDLTDAEGDGWCEYDDTNDQPVGITGLKVEFRVLK
mmetsp:Transcript_10356/g.25873  ORF Transcript_10356/g.25873 Transcript_10356/m.25873 type:complete len:172 (+) Transcript_10356:3-518(+)